MEPRGQVTWATRARRALGGVQRPRLGDLVAGVSVAIILVPQGLAYADLAGMPSHLGIVAGIAPAIVAALFASSPYLQTGPTALTALLVAGSLGPLATPGSPEYVRLGALLALGVGLARILFGLLRLGSAAYLVSGPVLTGFTTGAALLIVGSQVPTLLGVNVSGGRVLLRAGRALADPARWSLVSVALGAFTFALVVGLRRVHKLVPSVLVGVGASWALARGLDLRVATVGAVPGDLLRLSLDLPWSRSVELVAPALVIATIGFAEPSSIARTYAAAERQRWSVDRELLSQGAANVAAALTGAFPVGGSFGRSSLNHAAGAKTPWAGAITGLTVLAFVPFAGVVASVPRPALAAVVMSAVVSLVRVRRLRQIAKWSRVQAVAAALTLLATLALEPRVDRAIILGVGVALAIHLWRELKVVVVVAPRDASLVIELKGVLWFGSIHRVVERVLEVVAEHPKVERVVLDLRGVGRIDMMSADELGALVDDLRASGVELALEGIPPQAGALMKRVLGAPE
ncbi:MAG TPA: SulP family inorganic anion transporter [Polyangiaceae bacterium]|nr:SulP family inorganic anion transporter [Polyangiaceae bacterium]